MPKKKKDGVIDAPMFQPSKILGDMIRKKQKEKAKNNPKKKK